MSTATPELRQPPPPPPPREPGETYLNVTTGVMSWLLTKDHKRMAMLYLITVTFMFFLGGAAITIVRSTP